VLIQHRINPPPAETELLAGNIIIIGVTAILLIFLVRRYRIKKTIANILLIYFTLQWFTLAIGNLIFHLYSDALEPDSWAIYPLIGGFTIIIFILLLVISNIRLEKKVAEQYEQLKEVDQFRSDLVRRTTHELKTPLISLYSSSQYLLDTYKGEISEDILKFLKIINRGGKRLKLLTENLLDAYNLEIKGFNLEKERINIVKSIRDCANDLIFSLEERDLYLKEDLEEEFYIEVDKARIEQVILNLLSNAIKNTPPKGIIYIKMEHTKDFVEIIIKDTGIGLTSEEKERLFTKFGKIERKDIDAELDTEGSGLGLYISKEIIEMHDGEIIIESEGRKKGSTFKIRLPLKPVENT